MARPHSSIKPDYQLKHRLTGAAILIATGVIAIPLLLKDPGIQASIDSGTNSNQANTQTSFKSSIEPLNLETLQPKTKKSKDKKAKKSKSDKKKPALLVTNEVNSSNTVVVDTDNAGAKKESTDSEIKVSAIEGDKKPESKSESSLVLTSESNNRAATQSEEAVSTENEPVKNETEELSSIQGWTVRVGTFTKIENVNSVSQLLSKNGFNARRTMVTTNFGEATRVWLGPYDDKESARKVSARLKTLTGEEGYVTKHDS